MKLKSITHIFKFISRIVVIPLAVVLAALSIQNVVFAHGGDSSLIHACIGDNNGRTDIVGINDTCGTGETAVDWIKNAFAGTGLTESRSSSGVTISADTTYLQRRVSASCVTGSAISGIKSDGTVSCQSVVSNGDITSITAGNGLTGGGISGDVTVSLSDNGVTTAKLADGSVTVDKLASNASEKLYTLVYPSSSPTYTTSDTTVTFGTVNLPLESNICIMSMWVLQNNDSPKGLRASLVMDSVVEDVFSDTVAFSAVGIAYTIARNHCFSNVSAGDHTFGVKIDQFPFEAEKQIGIFPDSVMWITANPIQN